jgi:prophage maintenance system killer protein
LNSAIGEVVIYKSKGVPQLEVRLEKDNIWMTQVQIAELFGTQRPAITKHLLNIFKTRELESNSVSSILEHTAADGKAYKTQFYNLDAIISIGYRVNSNRATQFRIWASRVLKEYLVRGYALNEKLLTEKEKELESLKSGIVLIERSIRHQIGTLEEAKSLASLLSEYAGGLKLLDDYDHEKLDIAGRSKRKAVFVDYEGFYSIVNEMKKDFSSALFGKEKDQSFKSSIGQIYQSFGGRELYPSLEEKAVMLLYFIVKNHSFVDGNKRIAAACFLYFLSKNKMLYDLGGRLRLSNEALASLTLLMAESKPKEMETVKRIGISLLNRTAK